VNQKLVKTALWTAAAPKPPVDDDAPSLPVMTPEEEAAALCAGRANAAMTNAAIAWRSANTQLESILRTRRLTSVSMAALGTAGLAAIASFELAILHFTK
jgi:hypothetical protein